VTRLASGVNHTQRPAYYDETSGDRIFLSGAAPSNDRPTQPQLPVQPPPTVSAALPPPRLPGCLVRVFQYPTTPQGTTRYDEISATEFRETGVTNNAEAEVAFREGGRAWTDANTLKSKRADGRCPRPTFPLHDPPHNIP
jgi:hypothetical protein